MRSPISRGALASRDSRRFAIPIIEPRGASSRNADSRDDHTSTRQAEFPNLAPGVPQDVLLLRRPLGGAIGWMTTASPGCSKRSATCSASRSTLTDARSTIREQALRIQQQGVGRARKLLAAVGVIIVIVLVIVLVLLKSHRAALCLTERAKLVKASYRTRILACLAMIGIAATAAAQELRRGIIIDDVKCAADATQSYALYRAVDAIRPTGRGTCSIAFHPGARRTSDGREVPGRAPNNTATSSPARTRRGTVRGRSRWRPCRAMSADLGQRFSIDAQRVYLTGLSGGARVAMQVALGKTNNIAGVIASSAGYPDSQPRSRVPFAVFGTAGTEDFNYIEMRLLDRKLTSPHHLAVFNGGHTLPPDAVALEAIEWMELQAMKSGGARATRRSSIGCSRNGSG